MVRNGRLWTTHHLQVNESGAAQAGTGRVGVRWYELQNLAGSPSMVQAGTVFDPAAVNPASYWFGAIMPNGQGHVALGMSTAGPTTRVNAAVTGRLAGDALGTMNGAPVVYSPNTSFAYNVQSSPDTRQRWGDYSFTSIDPDDDMTLWTLQEYVDAEDSYGVRLVRLLAPPPAAIVSVTPSTIAATQSGATLTVTGTSSAGSGFFDPGAGFARRIAAAFSGGGITVTAVTVTSATTLSLTVDTSGAAPGARTLTVTNPDGQIAQRASAITIASGANGAPVSVGDAYTTPFGAVLNVPAPGALGNDTDPEGQPLAAQLVTGPVNGALTLNANGSFLYTPGPGFSGGDSFTYRASDGIQTGNAATVSITVAANRPPAFAGSPSDQTLFAGAAGASTGPLPFAVGDPDGAAVAVSAVSSNTAVVPATGLALGGSGANRTVTVNTAGATSLGVSTITLNATDGFLTASVSFQVSVQSSAVPGAPRTLAVLTSRNAVQLSWQPPVTSEPVQGYRLEAGFFAGTTALVLPLGPTLGFQTSAADGVYFVRVRAVTPAGVGPPSNEVVVVLGQAGPPLAPQSLLATVQGSAVTLRWSENAFGPTITGYRVLAGTASGLANIGVIPLAATARGLSVSAPAGTYFVRVAAVNAAGLGAASNEAVVTTGAGVCTVPAAPTGLVAASAPGVISVRWNTAAAGAIPLTYVVAAGSVSGAADRGTFSVPPTTTAVGGAVPAGPYFVRVAAGNACGLSSPSAEVSTVVP